jgi:transcriptional regulator with PAS, ATPase and Fis domain
LVTRIETGSNVSKSSNEVTSGLFSESELAPLEFSWKEHFPEIVGRSTSMKTVLSSVFRVAKADCPVLISGESGTGKELIAAALHRLSTRSTRRFVAINCSAIPETLLETELFGHEKGAFTGASSKRTGLLDAAHGGTLFLDEIGDMTPALQTKLLRVLQEKQFTPIGGTAVKRADVRIVAATNVNLEQAVQQQKFRLDLYYRLNVIPVDLPSLKTRQGDITELARHFLKIYNRIHCPQSPKLMSDELVTTLENHSWPGNIRELQNLVERLVVTSDGKLVTSNHLPMTFKTMAEAIDQPTTEPLPRPSTAPLAPMGYSSTTMVVPESYTKLPNEGINLSSYMESLENSLILQALDRTNNNKNQAAKLLGLNRTTLVERLKKRKLGK